MTGSTRPPAEGAGSSELVHGLFNPDTELGRALAAVDWSATPLGPAESWPTSLRNVVRLLLGSRFAMWMAWGPELTFLCNDAYRRDTLGTKFPWALGRPAAEVWSEIWNEVRPRIESVIATGEATWDEDLMLFLERSGYPEETYHTFSYSPITDDSGAIAGMLCVVSEETGRVIGERRMRIVRDLGTALAAASTVSEVSAAASGELSLDGISVPFAVAYLFDPAREKAELAFTAHVPPGHPIAPSRLAVSPDALWPTAALARAQERVVDDLLERFGDVPTGRWAEPPQRALLVPFTEPGQPTAFGFLVAGLNRYRPLDADYRGFIQLVAGQVAAAVTRARIFEEERRRAEELAELDQAKTAFFTNVSHELRTPLTLLLGPAADALADTTDPLSPAQRARVDVVQRNAERLLKLVNTLLDFSRLESGQVRARFEPLDLARYTAELAAMFDSAFRRAGLTLEVDCHPLPQRAHVDREMWAKIVLNLLSNALKATFTGGATVRLRLVDGAAELSVTDTGVGIPAAEQARLFERFHRVLGAQLRSHEGSGIGLALVAELAAVHGGEVGVDSAPGRGSTFTVRIPIGAGHLPAEQVVSGPVDDLPPVAQYGTGYLAEADRWLTGDEERERFGGEGLPRVLVADDNADMRNYVADLIGDQYDVVTAVDGQEALELARAEPPDLVLTDVMMPRLDGFGLLAALRGDPATMHVPVVMLSARSGEEAAVVGLEAGADDYLVKPFSGRELLARVRANLELDRVRRVADELHRSRTLLDQAEALAQVGSWELDLRSGRLVGSAEYLRILGVPGPLDVPGGVERAFAVLHPDDRDRVEAAIRHTSESGEPLELEARVLGAGGDGATVRTVRARGLLHRGPDGAPLVIRGSAQDVTEQRRAERAIAASAAARESAAREHAIAEELQRSLLPAGAPTVPGLDVAAYYVAGVEGTQAGGDWYDVIDLGDGRAGFAIGDVMGRGVRAAAVMGQLRATVLAYARLDMGPGELLQLLDAALRDVHASTIVTCIYGVHDRNAGTFTYASAGHLPPLLTEPGGRTRRLAVGDPPLGSGAYAGTVETVPVPPGARLTLYTDGLVEHRGSDIDTGIDRVCAVLDSSPLPVEALPGQLVEALLPAAPDDDVAVLCAEVAGAAARAATIAVTPSPTGVAAARHQVTELLAEWGLGGDVASDLQLIVSELATNCVRYGEPPMQLRLRVDAQQAVVEAWDAATTRPEPRPFDPGAANGRGLHLVAGLSSAWGVRPTGAGKAVWCTVPLRSAE